MSRNGSSWPDSVDLSGDTWHVEAGWGARPDDPAGCAARLSACLTELAGREPLLSRWFYDEEPVRPGEPALLRRVEANWDGDSGQHGTVVPLRNGERDDRTVATLTVRCGSTESYLPNHVLLRPPPPATAPALYRPDAMLDLVDAMVSVWQPQWCRVQPQSLRRATNHDTVDVSASWIVYLDRAIHQTAGPPPAGATATDRPAGTVFVLAPTPEQLRVSTVDTFRGNLVLADARRLG